MDFSSTAMLHSVMRSDNITKRFGASAVDYNILEKFYNFNRIYFKKANCFEKKNGET